MEEDINKLTYSEAVGELEHIVQQMQSNDSSRFCQCHGNENKWFDFP